MKKKILYRCDKKFNGTALLQFAVLIEVVFKAYRQLMLVYILNKKSAVPVASDVCASPKSSCSFTMETKSHKRNKQMKSKQKV
jgi:hypothetical protein